MKHAFVSKIAIITLISGEILGLGALPLTAYATPPIAIDPLGTNIVDSSGTVYMITTENGQTVRRPYTSAGAFLSYGFNSFSKLSKNYYGFTYPVGSFIPPRDGTIMCSDRGADKGTCYLISQSKKLGFPSEYNFTQQGFAFKYALYGDVSFLPTGNIIENPNQAHNSGVIVNKDGTLYIVASQGVLFGFPSVNVFTSWGYTFADAIIANATDKAPIDGNPHWVVSVVFPVRTPGLLSPFQNTLANGEVTLQGRNAGIVSSGIPDTGYTLYLNTQNQGQIKIAMPGFIVCPDKQIEYYSQIGDALEVRGNYANGIIDICGSGSYYLKKNASNIVQINNLNPSSGPIGSHVMVTGSGFTSADNIISFVASGSLPWGIADVQSSANGTSLNFTIPNLLNGCPATVPLCPGAQFPITPGSYGLFITNKNGTSNTTSFTVTQ